MASALSRSDSSVALPTISSSKKADLPIVLVLGLTGAGKTTFINQITNANLAVSRGMAACTTTSTHATGVIDGVEVAFVDTPGFDDPEKSDAGILIDITTWIKDHLGGQTMVTAALYLHSIQTKRLHGSASRNFLLFKTLVGSESMANVGLVSTHWDVALKDEAMDREVDLTNADWSIMLKSGARVYRLFNDAESAQQMVVDMLRSQPKFIKIQTEMAREFGRKPLSETEAGKGVCNELMGRIDKEQADLHALEQFLAKRDSMEPGVKEKLEKEAAELRLKLHQLQTDRKNVEKVPSWGATIWDLTKKNGLGLAMTAIQYGASGAAATAAANAATNKIAELEAQLAAAERARSTSVGGVGPPIAVGLAVSVGAVAAKIYGFL